MRLTCETRTWHAKAHRLIAEMCQASYAHANRKADGTLYRRHRPYSVPALAGELVDCLGANNEEGAKAVFLAYEGSAQENKR